MNAPANARVVEGLLKGSPLLLDPRLQRVIAAINGDGEEIRIVGGAVRNALIHEEIHDVDLATTALPIVVQARAAKAVCAPYPRASSTAQSPSWWMERRSK